MPVEDTGRLLKVPVSNPILSRLFDACGHTIDCGPPSASVDEAGAGAVFAPTAQRLLPSRCRVAGE